MVTVSQFPLHHEREREKPVQGPEAVCVPTMPAIVPGAMAGARVAAAEVVVLDGAAWYGVVATKGVVVVTAVERLVCNVGRGDVIMEDVRVMVICGLPTGERSRRIYLCYSRWSSPGLIPLLRSVQL